MTEADVLLDCYGLLCPMPIFRTAEKIEGMAVGQVLQVLATDVGIKEDMMAWCRATGHELLDLQEDEDEYRAYVRKAH